jgi:uncharacterized protein (TIGR03083 family)
LIANTASGTAKGGRSGQLTPAGAGISESYGFGRLHCDSPEPYRGPHMTSSVLPEPPHRRVDPGSWQMGPDRQGAKRGGLTKVPRRTSGRRRLGEASHGLHGRAHGGPGSWSDRVVGTLGAGTGPVSPALGCSWPPTRQRAVSGRIYHAAMPTQLSLEQHLEALVRSGAALGEAATAAGLDAKVPTCPGWDVTDLVVHQGMVHRWAAANLRGETDHDTAASQAEARAAASVLDWYTQGLAALVDTLRATAEDAKAMVFLRDAPPPRRFWARRQAHETTIHSVDAVAAVCGRWPTASEVEVDPVLAADGIDELLMGFLTRGKGRLHAAEPYTVLVQADDTGHAWTLWIGEGPIVATPGGTERPGVVFSGTAVQLYLSLWNRADEITTNGRSDLVDQWRKHVRIRWS